MPKSTPRPITYHLYFSNPLHLFKIQHSQILTECWTFFISLTPVSTEKDEHWFISYTRLSLQFGLELHGTNRRLPSPLWSIEDMIVFEYFIVITSIDEHFITIYCCGMESAAVWHNFLAVSTLKPWIHYNQRVIEFIAWFTLLADTIPPNINRSSPIAHMLWP